MQFTPGSCPEDTALLLLPVEIVKRSSVVMEQWHAVAEPANNGVEKREGTKASVQMTSANRCQTQVPIYFSTCARAS